MAKPLAKPASPARRRRRYASFSEAAEYLGGLNPRTIRRWALAGKLTGYRVGPKLIKVDLDELDRLVRPVATAGSDAG